MRQKKGLITEQIADEIMVVPIEGKLVDTALSLNESGGFVWKLLEQDRTREELTESVIARYGISREQAEEDMTAFLETVRDYIEA